jgi:hypothetical protein
MLELYLDNKLFMSSNNEKEIMIMYHWLIDLGRNARLVVITK